MTDKIVSFFINLFLEKLWSNLFALRFCFILLSIMFIIVILKWKEIRLLFFKISYNELCLKIGTLLNKNNNLFREFGPNSSSNSEHIPFTKDLNQWKFVRNNEIYPNNQALRELIENSYSVIPAIDIKYFDAMINHIIAFECHIKDDTIDYSNQQFPVDFEKLIYSKCEYLNKKHIKKISKWISRQVSSKKYQDLKIAEVWLFGSILKSEYKNIGDVDIIIFSELDRDIIKFSKFIKTIEKDFKKKFNKNLNITKFIQVEEYAYKDFLYKINIKKEI